MRTELLLALLSLAAASPGSTEGRVGPAELREQLRRVDRSIEETEKLIAVARDAPHLPDLQLRLAELVVEKSRYTYHLQAELNPPGAGPVVSTETRLLKEKAVSMYEQLLREYPQYRQADKVRFYLAHEQRELGRVEAMLATAEELVRRHPRSPLRLEAEQLLGDHYFDRAELERAERHYKSILRSRPSSMHNLARYKLGWIRVNQGRHREALAFFEAAASSKGVPRSARQRLEGSDPNLRRQALVDLVYSYTECRRGSEALAYFSKLSDSPATYALVLEKLVTRYTIKQQPEFAVPALRKLLEIAPDRRLDLERVQRLDDGLRLAKGKVRPRAADVAFAVRAAATVRQEVSLPAEEREKALGELEELARDLAVQLHAHAKKLDRPALFLEAARAYGEYLSFFQPERHLREMMHNRANALLAGREYYAAGKQFEALSRLEADARREEASYAALAAHVEALEPGRVERLGAFEKRDARQGVKLLGAELVRRNPSHPRAAEVELNVARAHYDDGELGKAAELFADFALRRAAHKDAAVAGHLALDALRRQKDFQGLERTGRRFLASRMSASFQSEVRAILARAQKEAISELALTRASGGVGVVEGLAKVAEEHRGQELGERALYGAVSAAREAGDVSKERELAQRLLAEYPRSSFAPEVLLSLGRRSAEAARFLEAASWFEQAAERLGQDTAAAESWLAAARLRLAHRQPQPAVKDLEAATEVRGPRQPEAFALLAAAWLEEGKPDRASSAASRALELDSRNAEAAAILATLAAGGDEAAARLSEPALMAMSQSPGVKGPEVAKGLWHLAEREYRAYRALGPEQLDEKIISLSALERRYSQAASIGAADFTVASLWRLALAYQDVVEKARAAPPPRQVKRKQLQRYKAELEGQIAPLVRKTEELFALCTERAEAAGVYTTASLGCRERSESPATPPPMPRGSGAGDGAEPDPRRRDAAALEAVALEQLKQGRVEVAQLTLSRVVELDDRLGSAHNALGMAALTLGDGTAAAAAYKKALEVEPKLVKAQVNLAALKCRFGDREGAKRELSEAKPPPSLQGPDVDPHWRSCL